MQSTSMYTNFTFPETIILCSDIPPSFGAGGNCFVSGGILPIIGFLQIQEFPKIQAAFPSFLISAKFPRSNRLRLSFLWPFS
jgi:hypothetical protein